MGKSGGCGGRCVCWVDTMPSELEVLDMTPVVVVLATVTAGAAGTTGNIMTVEHLSNWFFSNYNVNCEHKRKEKRAQLSLSG